MLSNKKKQLYRYIGWFYLFNTLVFWLLGYSFLRSILQTDSLFQNDMVDFSNTYGSYFVLSYAIINYLSYMTVLAFIPACFMWGIAIILPHRQLLMVFGILAASFCAFMLIIDAQVYSMFRFHLNSAILHMIFNEHALDIFDLSSLELLEFGLIFFFFIVFEAFLAYFVWNKIIVTQRLMIGKTLALLWFGGFLFSYFSLILSITHGNNLLSQQNPNLPFFNQFIAYIIPNTNAGAILIRTSETHFSQPIFPRTPINYPLHSLQCAKKIKPYNIIFILVDSLRFDSLSEKNMPKLNEFSLENWRFFNHFSGGNATQPGLFSLFYSIPSSYWTAALEQKKRPAFLNILDKYNYKTRIIWSSQMQYPPFDKTIYLGLKHLHNNSSIGEDIGSWDRRTTELAINFLNKNKRERPFFLNLFYNAPHAFCSNQSFPSIYPLPTKTCSRIMLTNSMDPKPLYHRYLNAVHFIDDEISNVLNVIKKMGYLHNSIIIISSDHGQEFNDNHQNFWGHSGNFTKFQTKVPLVIHWPNQSSKQVQYVTTSYDLIPTLLQNQFGCTNSVNDYSIGQNLLKNVDRRSFIITGSYTNMGLIESDRITTLNASGQISITDLIAKPTVNTKIRSDTFKKALSLMRKYSLTNKTN